MVARITALFLALLIGIGAILPLQSVQAESGPKHKRHAKRYKKYSKGWWRQYRARMKRKRAMQLAKRKIRLEQLRTEKDRVAQDPSAPVKPATKPNAATAKKSEASAPAVLPSGDPAPAGWKPAPSTSAELQFRVDNSSGVQIGSAAISVVGPSMPAGGSRNKSIGGVATSSLRRDVIDKMIKENGWVVNDFQKEVDGQQVYVVVAQSQAANGSMQSRMFYFTEVDGRIYSVSTKSPAQDSERLAEESEKVINSLKNARPSQRAAVKQ